MSPFTGFSSGKGRPTPLPAQFFIELLPEINYINELKVTLYVLWFLNKQDNPIRYLLMRDFFDDDLLLRSLDSDPEKARFLITDGLEKAVQRGTLLRAAYNEEGIYFLNSSKGRAALDALQRGDWRPDPSTHISITLQVERPNIFKLYEDNIGALTPMIADALKDAEQLYPNEWIEEAIQIAVHKNARNWRFIQAVLRTWKEKGHYDTDRRGSEENRRRYVQGEFSDYIEH